MDTTNDGWAFLIPFVLFALILLVVMLTNDAERAEKDRTEAPKAPSPDPLYDWAEEEDFKQVEEDARPVTLYCARGCPDWRFIDYSSEGAEALRAEHYEEHHPRRVTDGRV